MSDRDRLLSVITSIEKMMNSGNCDKQVIDELHLLKADMEDDFFTVLVVGEFKRGKTTFVNALLGEDLLITDVLPETATIQAVFPGEEKRLQVIYKDGLIKEGIANKEYLNQFSAKAEEANKVSYIKIQHPVDFIDEKTILVDTPGVSDLDEQRVQVTYSFLPKANVVLFVLDATAPMSKSEKEFIEEQLYARGIEKVIFILNKYDLVDEDEDGKEYLQTVRSRIEAAFGEKGEHEDATIIPVSSWDALDAIENNDKELYKRSNIGEVKKTIRELIDNGEVEKLKIHNYASRLQNLITNWKQGLHQDVVLLSQDTSVLADEVDNLHQAMEKANENYYKIDEYVENEVEMLMAMVNKSLSVFHKSLNEDVDYEVDRYMGTEFKSFVERDIPHIIKKRSENWMSTRFIGVERDLSKLEERISTALSRYFNSFVSINTYQEEFSVTPDMELDAKDVSGSQISAGLVTAGGLILMTSLGLGMMAPLVSMVVYPSLRKSFIESNLKESKTDALPQIHEQIDKYFGTLESQIYRSIDERVKMIVKLSKENFESNMQAYAEKAERCLAQKRNKQDEIKGLMDLKQHNIECVDKILIGLEGMV